MASNPFLFGSPWGLYSLFQNPFGGGGGLSPFAGAGPGLSGQPLFGTPPGPSPSLPSVPPATSQTTVPVPGSTPAPPSSSLVTTPMPSAAAGTPAGAGPPPPQGYWGQSPNGQPTWLPGTPAPGTAYWTGTQQSGPIAPVGFGGVPSGAGGGVGAGGVPAPAAAGSYLGGFGAGPGGPGGEGFGGIGGGAAIGGPADTSGAIGVGRGLGPF